MNLERLELRGFKTFSNATLPISSLPPGLHFIVGKNLSEPELESNGSGKSSLFAGLFWCLFGKTVDGLRNSDVKPWALKEKTQVTVRLGGTTVCRSVSPNRLTIDGKDAGPEQVEKLLGMGFDLASHTLLMGQGRPLFFDLAPAQKMSLLSEALGLERWEGRSKLASERHGALERELEGLERTVHSQTNLDAELYQLMRKAQEKASEWDAQEQVDLDLVRKAIDSKTIHLERFQVTHAKYDLEYDGAQTELRALARGIRDLNQRLSQARMSAARGEQLRKELESLDQAKTCPTCGQPVSGKNLAQHKAELIRQLDEFSATIHVEELENQLRNLLINEEQFQAKSNQALDRKTQTYEALTKLEAEIAELKKSLGKKQKELNPFHEQVLELKQRRSAIVKDLQRLEKEVMNLKTQMELVKFWVKGFKEVKLYILEEILQDMELITNASLEEVGLVGWQAHYEVEKETKSGGTHRGINVWIKSPSNDQPVRWECWSGGESQRLKIIGAAALSDVLLANMGVQCNVEVWDEASSFMSEGGVEDFIEFLANRAADQSKVIFMVDHLARESARFASVITVTKRDGVSTLT